MKIILQKTFIISILGLSNLYSWEVNTHQALTRCAITDECKNNGSYRAENLQNFVNKDTLLSEKDYTSQTYEEFPKFNYRAYAISGEEAFYMNWKIGFTHKGDYIDMIEAGSILEDALYPDADTIAQGGDGRFNNHFYDPQINTREECTKEATLLQSNSYLLMINHMVGNKALCVGYGDRTDAVQWAIKGDKFKFGTKADVRTNNYSYGKALEYYKESFSSETKTKREENQAKMFVSLGHLLHLLQDMHVPAHVRNDSHAEYDLFEYWARRENGFNLSKGKFKNVNKNVFDAVKNYNTLNLLKINKSILASTEFPFAESFYIKEATFTSNNFLSFGKDKGLDMGTLFDNVHSHPSKDTDVEKETVYENKTLGYITSAKYYYNSLGNTVNSLISGNINPKKVALRIETKLNNGTILLKTDDDNSVIIDNALNIIPRAVGASEAFINYFFRGRIEVKIIDGKLVVKNISNPNLAQSPKNIVFRKDGHFIVKYDAKDGTRKTLISSSDDKGKLDKNLNVNDTFVMEDFMQILDEISDMGDAENIIVLYDGNIGQERGLAVSVVNNFLTSSVKVETTSATDSILLTWNKVEDASGYTICKSESEITDGAECVKNGGELLTSSTTKLKISELKENTVYYFRVKANNEDFWSEQVSSELTPYLLFMLPKNASLDGYKLTATKGDTISFSSSNSRFSEYIKESNARSDEDVIYTLWYIDGETGKTTSVVLTLDEDTETFSFVMPSSSITPQNILNNIDRSIGFPHVWESKEAPNPDNTPPTANAGKDKKNVSIDAEVHLSGKDSNDTEGDPLTYLWSFVSKPSNSSATLSDATIVNPTFTADEHGTYTIQLVVNDGFSNSSPDTVVIETDEEAPIKEVNPTSCTPEFD